MGYKINNNPEQINGPGRQTLRIELDAGTYDSFDIVVQATIQGGAAGTSLLSMIEDVRLYSQGGIEYFDMPFTAAQEADFRDVINDLRPAIVNQETQLFIEENYIDGILCFNAARVFMPLIVTTAETRILEVVFNPLGADAAITGASGDLNVTFESGTPTQEFQVITPNVKIEDKHRIMCDYFDGVIVRVVLDNFTNMSLDSVKMKGADNEFDLYFDEKSHLIAPIHDYAITRQDTATLTGGSANATGVNFTDVLIQPYDNRRLDFDLDAPQRINVRVYTIATLLSAIGGTAGDSTRGNAEAETVDMTSKAAASTVAKEAI